MMLTAGKVRMRKHQLQASGSWMLFSAIWRIYEESQVLLKGLKQGPNKRIIGLVGLVCEVLFCVRKTFSLNNSFIKMFHNIACVSNNGF